ncbi:MAG: 2-C-methyl-D-erythritol 4-phosphate cytidylyltransferase [Planctomycetota bacterium]
MPSATPRFSVVLAAAGASRRFRAGRPDGPNKPFVSLAGRPLWSHAAGRFAARDDVAEIVMAVDPESIEDVARGEAEWLERLGVRLVGGGAERADSVANAVRALKSDADFIAVHDAARPLVSDGVIDAAFAGAAEVGAAAPGLPIVGTVKQVDDADRVTRTVDRTVLREVQTPQVARADWLREAFATVDLPGVTDEASLLERAGRPVLVTAGARANLKVTTREDLDFVNFLLSRNV